MGSQAGVGKKYGYLATGRQERVKRKFIGESEKTRLIEPSGGLEESFGSN